MNMTEKCIEKLRPSTERQTHRDDEMTGFGIRVEPASSGGRRSFFYNAKVGGRVVFKSLGEWPTVSVKDARDKAREWAGKAAAWKQAGFPEESNPFAKPRKAKRTTTPTFSELVEAYVAQHVRPTALHPAKAEYDLRLLVGKYLSSWLELPVDKITVEHVLAAKNSCKFPYMQNSIVDFSKRVFNWSTGSQDGKLNFWKIAANPAADVGKNPHQKRKRFLEADELLRFHAALKDEPHVDTRDVLALLLSTGARKSNVYAMAWRDVSFERQQWHVPRSKSGDKTTGDPGDYTVELTREAMTVLERRRDEQGDTESQNATPWVFPSRSKSGHIEDIKKRWIALRKRANLTDIRLHDLRRTRGSWAAISGQSLQKVGALLGHKSLASTEIYARLSQESVRQASEASDDMMKVKMAEARKRLKRGARKPRLLEVANG